MAWKLELDKVTWCKNYAIDFISMNMNPWFTEIIFYSFKNALKKMAEIRSGFYCILCDGWNQDLL